MFNGKKQICKRGQFITGIHKLKQKTGIEPSKLRRLLETMKNEHLIDKQSNNKFSLITILKYDYYQSADNQNDKPVTNKRQTSDKPVTTTKNDKNDKNVNNTTPPVATAPVGTTEPGISEQPRLNTIANIPGEVLSLEMAKVFNEWRAYKTERGQSYKKRGEAAAIKKLLRFSGGDPRVAEEIVEEAMANNWAGFFELKRKGVKDGSSQVIEAARECIAEFCRRESNEDRAPQESIDVEASYVDVGGSDQRGYELP